MGVTFWYLQHMKDEMAKPLGLTPRGGSLQLRIIIPKDLRHLYDGRADFRVSLGKLDKAIAQPLAHRIRAEKEEEFARKRRELNPQAVVDISPQLAKAIASQAYSRVLQQDDDAREADAIRDALLEVESVGSDPLSALKIGSANSSPVHRHDPLGGLPSEAADTLAGLNALKESQAAIDLARRNLAAVKPLADEVAKSMGLLIDWTSPGGREALKEVLVSYRKANADRVKRDAGDWIETPAPGTLQEAAPVVSVTHKLSEVFDKWAASGANPSDATVRKKRVSVRHYERIMKDAPIESLTKEMGLEFSTALLAACNMHKTAKDHLDGVKSLLSFACEKLGWIKTNEWAQHSIEVKKRNQRKPWPVEDLRKLVDSPLFKAYELPSMAAAGGAAAYWVTLLGLYTGARQSELCQLRITDIQETADGLVLFVLNDEADTDDGTPGTTTKTEASNRRLPVHPELIALGFDDYWRDMKAAGHKVLFPDIRRAANKLAGEYFSDWFLIYRRQQGIGKRWVDFQGFRHTAATRLTDACVPDSVSAYLTGHSAAGRGSFKTYRAMAELRPALERLTYAELGLKRVYRR